MNYVGFSTTNKIISRFIRWVTGSKISHTFLVVELYGKFWVIGAEFQGIMMLSMERFQRDNTVKALCEIPELTDEHLAKAMESLGEAYDFIGLVGGVFPQIGRWFKRKWKNPWTHPKTLICSEFVILTLQECGFKGAENLDPTSASPEELREFLYNAKRTKLTQ